MKDNKTIIAKKEFMNFTNTLHALKNNSHTLQVKFQNWHFFRKLCDFQETLQNIFVLHSPLFWPWTRVVPSSIHVLKKFKKTKKNIKNTKKHSC